ncbi:MAG TPA: YdcF family protein [Bryobacteraceae bacterium]|nr:YdcF family protein [Bryobacteraceae bacterium]
MAFRIGNRVTTAGTLVLIVLAACGICLAGQEQPVAAPLVYKSPVQDKNFYLLSLMERTPAVRAAIGGDAALKRMAAARVAALGEAVKNCKIQVDCYGTALKWNDSDVEQARQSLVRLCGSANAVRAMVGELRRSGMYVRYGDLDDAELLGRVWADTARGLNHAIDVYGLGGAPRYPAIDAATNDVKTEAGARTVATLAEVIDDGRDSLQLFFQPGLRFALGLMDLNHRDEAGRFEPMEKGENAAAFRKIKSTDWKRYPYTVIVVPGAGNDRPGVRLSPYGKLRVELAVNRYRAGKAPFILVSGGFVHPVQTPYAEAIEMKHELMEKYSIPEEAILVDPHARHTTTNLRNAARIMFRYGMPFGAKALITSDPGQSSSIESPAFNERCIREIGYVPHTLLGRISMFDLEWTPKLDALHSDWQDLLDP